MGETKQGMRGVRVTKSYAKCTPKEITGLRNCQSVPAAFVWYDRQLMLTSYDCRNTIKDCNMVFEFALRASSEGLCYVASGIRSDDVIDSGWQ